MNTPGPLSCPLSHTHRVRPSILSSLINAAAVQPSCRSARWSALSASIAALLLSLDVHAKADPTPAISTANSPTIADYALFAGVGNWGGTIGWQFQVGSADITISSLGVFDHNSDGLLQAHQVGIWNSSGALLTQATVGAGTSGTLLDSYRYQTISSLTLSAGQTYTIGTFFSGVTALGVNDDIIAVSSQTFGAGIQYLQSRQTILSTIATFSNPTLDAGVSDGVFGPTFQFDLNIQSFFWDGRTDGDWRHANWATTVGDAQTGLIPGAGIDVIFSTNNATGQTNTTLGQDFTIHSLTINDAANVTIGGANTLTISGDSGTGIVVNSGAGLFTLNSNLALAGSSDTITVNNLAGAVINGSVSAANGLTKLGTGTLTFAGGGTFNNKNVNLDGGSTVVTSALTNIDQFYVGYSNSGVNLTISGGGSVSDVSGAVGVSTAGAGTATVTGTGSKWTNTGDLNVGFDGSNSLLQILSGGTVSANYLKISGGAATTNNKVVVSGTGSSLTTTNDIIVGYAGANSSLAIDSGAHVTSVNTLVGNAATATGSSVTVDGAGSLWTNTGTYYVGVNSTSNTATVSNGGKIAVTLDAVIGQNSGSSSNELDVKDANSQFTTSGALYVGNGGSNNSLNITNGGVVKSNLGRIGALATSSGNQVQIDGTGSLWDITGTLRVGGAGGSNTLNISNGGHLNVGGNSFVGYFSTSTNNSVVISDAGSSWTANALFIGRDGTNNYVFLKNGGSMSASSITLAQNAGSSGFLDIGFSGGAAGTVSTSTITGGSGTGGVIFDHGDAGYVFSPTLAGNLFVQHNGPGETILTGSNTYSGPTYIFGGTLRTQNATALGAGTVALSGGTLAVEGTLNVNALNWGSGKLQLAPVAGPVNIATLLANTGGGGSYILDTTGFTIGTSYTLTTFGTQSGFSLASFSATALNPNIQLQGFFTLDPNDIKFTLTGGTTTGSIIQNSEPVGTPTFVDFVVAGPVTTGGPTEDNTIHGLIFEPGGSLLVHNTLFLTQTAPQILPGGSTITLDGFLSLKQLNMLLGSLLNGNGGILGNLVNGGLVSPGHSPGQIHVSGNYTQTPSGTLRIEIAGRDLSQHDLLSVGGTATLDGTLQLVRLDGFKLKRNKPVTFLTANHGVVGKFTDVENGFTSDTILEPTVVYHDNSVALEAVQGSFAALPHLTPNQKSVARALDSIDVHDHRANSLLEYLDYRKLNKLPGDLDKIAPEELNSIFTIGTSLAKVQSGNIQRRNDDIRSGSGGFNAAGLALNGTGPSYSGSFGLAGPIGPISSDDGKDMKATKEVVPPADNRWGVFLSGTGEWVGVGNTDNARGYDLTSGGFTLGIDYKVTPNFAVGLAAGYTGSSADLTDRGRVYVNGGKLGLYATFFQNEQVTAPSSSMSKDAKEVQAPVSYNVAKGFYADVAVFGGYNSYDTRRSALQGEARGDTEGGELNVLAGIGYDFKKGNLTFGPTASFNYTYLGTDAFTEHGSLAPLNIHGGKGESLRTAFGIKASYDWKVGSVLIKPEIRAAWQHEFGDAAYALDSSFANGAGDTFRVNGPQLGRDSALLGAGFAIQFNDRFSAYFYYDGELGRKDYQSTNVTGGVRITF